MAVKLQLVTFIGKARSQTENATDKFMRKRAIVADVIALEAPDWLSVTILEIKMNPGSNIGRAGARIRNFGI